MTPNPFIHQPPNHPTNQPPNPKQLQPENACVLRDARWVNDLPARELVPGDIIFVKVGMDRTGGG